MNTIEWMKNYGEICYSAENKRINEYKTTDSFGSTAITIAVDE